MQLVNVPNVITLARALLVPVVTYALVTRDYDLALALFLACAIGDFLDGWIARRFDLRTRFGALADPLADKAIMLAVTLLLAWQGWLPWWLAVLVANVVNVAANWALIEGHWRAPRLGVAGAGVVAMGGVSWGGVPYAFCGLSRATPRESATSATLQYMGPPGYWMMELMVWAMASGEKPASKRSSQMSPKISSVCCSAWVRTKVLSVA